MALFGHGKGLGGQTLRTLVKKTAAGLLVCIAFLVVFIGKPEGRIISTASSIVTDIASPVVAAIAWPVNKIRGVFAAVARLRHADVANAGLALENQFLKDRVAALEAREAETDKVAAACAYFARTAYRPIAARVVGGDGAGYTRSYILNSGAAAGVRRLMPVSVGGALVGQIAAAGEWYSRLVLLSDPASKVSVAVARTGARAFLFGTGGRYLVMRHFESAAVPEVGDLVITSGLDPNVPAGIAVGIVGGISEEDGVLVQPSADLDSLDVVAILKNGKPGEIRAFLESEAGAR